MKIAVVIPTYNEKETLPSLVEKLFNEIRPLIEELHIIIIDDSSPDGTADIAHNLGEKFQKISGLLHLIWPHFMKCYQSKVIG